MNIIPFNINKISFKGASIAPEVKTAEPQPEKEQGTTSALISNPIDAAQINIKTPISYNKIGDIKIPDYEEPAQVYKLANGQKVVILPKEGPAVVETYFKVGSMNEPDHLRGISHYIEHNLFNGSENLAPGEFFERVSQLGSNTNASTGYNQTNYYIKSQLLKPNSLEEIMKIHADQVQNPKFLQDQLTKEKGPVTSEISMYADNPFNVGRNIALKNLFQINSTSKDLVAGAIQNINAIKREDVVDYYNTWYTPDNAITVITGDVDPKEAMELVSKNFTKNKIPQQGNKKYEDLISIDKPVRVDTKMPKAPAAIINIGFTGPQSNNTKDKIASEVLYIILAGYKNARLSKALEPMQVSAEISAEKIGNKNDDKRAVFIGAVTPEEKSEETIKTIYKEVAKIAQNPPSKEEMDIAVSKLKMSISEVNERSTSLNEIIANAMLDNDINYLTNYKNILESLTPEDISNAAKNYLNLNKASVCVVHPKTTTNDQITNNYNNTNIKKPVRPSFGRSNANIDSIYSNVKEYKLQNNMEVAIKPTSNDFATFQMDFSLPAYLDASTPELMILSEMLNRGSISKDNQTFYNILDKSNTQLGFLASGTGLSISAKMPQDKLNQGLDLTKEVLLNPRFTKEDFEWAKQAVKEELEGEPKSADNKLDAALYPHIQYMSTKEDSLKKLNETSLEKIQAIYQAIINNVQGTAVLSAPTESNPQLSNDFINALSKDIPKLKPLNPASTQTYIKNNTPRVFTEAEQRLQAEVVQAYKFQDSRNIDDQAKINVLNMVLGGNSSSRLFSDLREKQKLAYYVASDFGGIGDTGIINMRILTTTDDNNDQTSSPENINKSIAGFQKHINKLKTEPITQEELEKAKLILKNNILNSLETSDEKNSDILCGKNSYYGINLTKDALDAIDRVTIKDVQDAANYAFKNPPITSIVASQKSLDQAGIKEA